MTRRRVPGRPAGHGGTREAVLRAAADSFMERGYRGTTLRSIATTVGVDVSTVVHHGGPKHQLFAAALAMRIGPASLLRRGLDRPRAEVPHAIAVLVSDAWSRDELRRPVESVIAAAFEDERVRAAVSTYLEAEMLQPLAEFIGGPGATTRATAVLAVAAGALLARYSFNVGASAGPLQPMLTLEPTLSSLLLGHAATRKGLAG